MVCVFVFCYRVELAFAYFFFFLNDPAPPEISPLPLHAALPISGGEPRQLTDGDLSQIDPAWSPDGRAVAFVQDSTETQEVRAQVRPQLYVLAIADRSEEHTSELQSRLHLVCRLLLEKKKISTAH